ncbi:hypothetical protein P3T39_007478 [Kitasatospora sp. GP82]|nr:hypothetical protein [Kitasatospora sp. GP82]
MIGSAGSGVNITGPPSVWDHEGPAGVGSPFRRPKLIKRSAVVRVWHRRIKGQRKFPPAFVKCWRDSKRQAVRPNAGQSEGFCLALP